MAFGKPPEAKRQVQNAVREDLLWRIFVDHENRRDEAWNRKWSWILDEYEEMHKKLDKVSEGSKFLSDVKSVFRPPDRRTIRPIPDSTNHEYGWLANLPQFKLETMGRDVEQPMPLPKKYLIFHGMRK